jgi:transcriptional regulator with XRE-family HTH domain
MARVSRTRPAVDSSPLAKQFGEHLRRARLEAGLTQQQLAEGRYTKAYVSALENGLSRPSMVALTFFSERLGVPASVLINDRPATWARIEADVALASGRWDDAIAAFSDLLDTTTRPEQRAELMSGLAEALVRRGRGREAIANAAEAARIMHSAGREPDAALAEYWLSAAHYQEENGVEARAILEAILRKVRAGLKVEPDFQMRVVMALSSNEARDGNHAAALAYLEEVRGLAAKLDDRRRASYLFDLAYSYRETGDLEASVRTAMASLELFRRVQADREAAALSNDLALSFLALNNLARASEMAADSRSRLEGLHDDWLLGHVIDTQARIKLAAEDASGAASSAEEALAVAQRSDNTKAAVDALLTLARARRKLGDEAGALDANGRAAELARVAGSPALARKALTEWAEALAAAGRHEQAFALMHEALIGSK